MVAGEHAVASEGEDAVVSEKMVASGDAVVVKETDAGKDAVAVEEMVAGNDAVAVEDTVAGEMIEDGAKDREIYVTVCYTRLLKQSSSITFGIIFRRKRN